MSSDVDPIMFGHRLRHFRRRAGLTLEQFGTRVGRPAPFLSQVETGKREPRLSDMAAFASALDVTLADLLDPEPPNRRARLEIAWEQAQAHPIYREFGLPRARPAAKVPDEVLAHIVELWRALLEASKVATAEEVRRANAAVATCLGEQDGYLPDVEGAAAGAVESAGYRGSGAVSQRNLLDLAAAFGLTIHSVEGVPSSVRSVTDLRSGRVYIPQRNALRTRRARKVLLQTLGHFALDHGEPKDFTDFLRQRVETAYFAAAVLVPEQAAAAFLRDAKDRRDLSVEDLKEVFYVSYESAAHRLTNLATHHLDIRTHFVRSDGDGVVWKAYQNDGVPFPRDGEGGVEAQRLCKEWGTRQAFHSEDKFGVHYQYTDTPNGTYWCSTHIEADQTPHHGVTVGTPFESARFFRGRETDRHTVSGCPEGDCCRRPPEGLSARWGEHVWPSARAQSRVLGLLASDPYPKVDLTEVYEFVERHAGS